MKLVVHDVSVAGPREPFVEHVTFTALPGLVTVVTGDPGVPLAALALALGGRVPLSCGSVELWGSHDESYLQEHVALVDVEDVTAPDESLSVAAVLREQLAFSSLRAGRRELAALITEHGITDARQRWDAVPALIRTELLLTLASRRPGTQVIVLAGPDRHGGEAKDWFAAAERVARDVFTVVVLCSAESATHIGATTAIPMGVSA